MQIYSCGLGLELTDYPDVSVFNCAPALLARWGIVEDNGRLNVPVTHRIPANIMGSGLGKNTVWRGDYDIQLFDAETRKRFRLASLRFGDMVAIVDADTRFGASFRQGYLTVGVIVHGDSTVSGHGPGVTPLLCGPAEKLHAIHNSNANLATIFNVRTPAPPQNFAKLHRRKTQNSD
jgi:Domain of unknown function (DUF4438)